MPITFFHKDSNSGFAIENKPFGNVVALTAEQIKLIRSFKDQ